MCIFMLKIIHHTPWLLRRRPQSAVKKAIKYLLLEEGKYASNVYFEGLAQREGHKAFFSSWLSVCGLDPSFSYHIFSWEFQHIKNWSILWTESSHFVKTSVLTETPSLFIHLHTLSFFHTFCILFLKKVAFFSFFPEYSHSDGICVLSTFTFTHNHG